jgi:hypothetical protein
MAKQKKPNRPVEAEPLKTVKRADVISPDGFAIVVDGIFKNEFESDAAAHKAARGLLEKYPMLRVEIYDASTKSRSLVDNAK